jgi:hypothetical protein
MNSRNSIRLRLGLNNILPTSSRSMLCHCIAKEIEAICPQKNKSMMDISKSTGEGTYDTSNEW